MQLGASHSDREVQKGTLKHVYVNLWARAKGQGRCLDKGASLTEPLTSEGLKPEADQNHVFPDADTSNPVTSLHTKTKSHCHAKSQSTESGQAGPCFTVSSAPCRKLPQIAALGLARFLQ